MPGRRQLLAATASMLLAAGAQADKPAYVEFDGQQLAHGRTVWLANCEGCHGYGIAGAPIPMEADAWRDRLRQSRATLYRHAIEGFFGPDDTHMPARGGNENLTDDEVRAAVDYMTELAQHYQVTEETKQ
jgi:cytochrome c5